MATQTKNKNGIKKLWKTIKVASFIVSLLTQLYYIFQLVYTIVQGSGETILGIDIAMLVISALYLGFFCYASWKGEKQLQKTIKVAFKWGKRLIKIVNLGIMLYLLLNAPRLDMWDTLVTVFSIVMWVLDFLMAIISIIVKKAFRAIIEKIDVDMGGVKASTGKFFKKFTKKGRAELAAAANAPPAEEPTETEVAATEAVAEATEAEQPAKTTEA